jgi:transposase
VVFGDESGFYLLPAVVRTYAPCGETPELDPFLTRDPLSGMGGITPAGHFYTWVQDTALTGRESRRLLQPLLRHGAEKLLVIWDGSSLPWATAVKTVLAHGGAQALPLVPLPGYAPELNPGEGVWALLKDRELRTLCCWALPHLTTELALAIRRLRNKPSLLQACFEGAGLAI